MRPGANALITIQPLKIEDKDPVCQLLKEAGVFSDEEIQVAIELIDIYLHDRDQKDYDMYSALTEKNDVVGYTCLGPTALTSGTFDLYWIAVKPSHQRSSVGTQLLHYAESLVTSKGGRLLISETSSLPRYEKTRKFYVRNAYRELARIKDFYAVGDDLVIYGKYLSQHKGI